jgi:hypothetical protein
VTSAALLANADLVEFTGLALWLAGPRPLARHMIFSTAIDAIVRIALRVPILARTDLFHFSNHVTGRTGIHHDRLAIATTTTTMF